MDLSSPRYADDPGLALRQMSFMTVDDEGFDPEAALQCHVEERRQAYEELMSRSVCGLGVFWFLGRVFS